MNVVVEDDLPAGVSINSVSASGGSCDAGVPGDPFLPTTCTFDSLANGASETMTIVVTVLPDTLGIIHNDTRVDSDTVDMDNSKNLAAVDTQVEDEADLAVVKSDFPEPVLAGDPLSYEVSIINSGPSLARDVVLTDVLSSVVTLTDTTISNGSGACVLIPGKTLSCQLNDLGQDEYVIVYIDVLVDPSVPHGTTITNSATVSTSATDPNSANNTDIEETTLVNAVADLEVLEDSNFEANNPSSTIIYTVTITNHGPSDALNVGMVDTLPVDPKMVRYVVDTGNSACGYDETPHEVTCIFGTLAAGDMISVQIFVEPKGSLGEINNIAVVTTDTVDPDLSNNTDNKKMWSRVGPASRVALAAAEADKGSQRSSRRENSAR